MKDTQEMLLMDTQELKAYKNKLQDECTKAEEGRLALIGNILYLQGRLSNLLDEK